MHSPRWSLHGQRALVTGASAGIGLAICRELLGFGAQVLMVARDPDLLEQARAELEEEFPGPEDAVLALPADVTDDEQRAEIIDWANDQGGLHLLVNNAGVAHLPQPLEGLPEDDFDRIAGVNMKAIYLAAREVVPRFKARKGGVILNVASTAGVSPRPKLAWYNASKGWVITATRAMAVELAPFGIRVVALNPVAGETPLLPTFMGGDTPENRARFLATIPLGRLSTPEDIGNAACFLCSDEASMITGVAMEIDGGRCI